MDIKIPSQWKEQDGVEEPLADQLRTFLKQFDIHKKRSIFLPCHGRLSILFKK